MQKINGKPVLYKCPYCVKGRFTEDDGWEAAVKHVRSHQSGTRKRSNRGRRSTPSTMEELDLLEESPIG